MLSKFNVIVYFERTAQYIIKNVSLNVLLRWNVLFKKWCDQSM